MNKDVNYSKQSRTRQEDNRPKNEETAKMTTKKTDRDFCICLSLPSVRLLCLLLCHCSPMWAVS